MPITVTHAKVSAVADGGDSALVQPSDWNNPHTVSGAVEVISTNTTWNVPADFATLQLALNNLKGKIITSNALVDIVLPSGQQSYCTVFPDIDMTRVRIRGTTATNISLTSVASSSGSAGSWSYVLNVADVGAAAIGDFVNIYSASGGTNPTQLRGTHEISAVGASTITITVKNYSATMASGAVTATMKLLKTYINGFKIVGSRWGVPYDYAMTTGGQYGSWGETFDHCAMKNEFYITSGARVQLNGSNTTRGFACPVHVYDGSLFTCAYFNFSSVSNNVSLRVSNGSTCILDGPTFGSGNTFAIRVTSGSLLRMNNGPLILVGPSTAGIYAGSMSNVVLESITNNAATPYSPLVATVGNDNSFITTTTTAA